MQTNTLKLEIQSGGAEPLALHFSADRLPGELIEALSVARAACRAAAAAVAEREADLAARQQRLNEAHDKLNRLVDLEKDDLVARILDGEDSRPKKPKRMAQIENLKEEIEGLRLAMPIIQGRLREAQENRTGVQEQYTTAILPLVTAERTQALLDLRSKLSELAPALARLKASAVVQERLVGDRFTYTGGTQEIFSGRI